MIKLDSIEFSKKNIISYNRTYKSFRKIFYPKNYNELKSILKFYGKKNKKLLIKSGECGHGDKTNLQSSELVISLVKLNKIFFIKKKKLTLKAQSGINLYKLFKILNKKKLALYNIPGGKNVSLGGAIAGNVHGRPQNEKLAVFGDNIINLKVMLENGKIISLTRKDYLFYKVIGGLSLFGIILEANIKLVRISETKFIKEKNLIENKIEFENLNKKHKNFYGYINLFNKKKFEGTFFTFKDFDSRFEKKIINPTKYTLQEFLYFFRLIPLISFFINNLTLKIFYIILFSFLRLFSKINQKNILDYESSIYFIDLNKFLPFYFKKGMIEIQFSVPDKNLFRLVETLKSEFSRNKIYPFFFIIKKLEKSIKKYIFNFLENKISISLCFSKKNYLQKRRFFPLLYNILLKNKCSIYFTKDETFIENITNNKIKMKISKSISKCNKIISSDFKEKIQSK